MSEQINIVVLAAGKGTRLNLDLPKPLCPIFGKTMLDFVMQEIRAFQAMADLEGPIDLIVGHQKELIEKHLEQQDMVNFIHQEKQLGTGHAIQVYFDQKENVHQSPTTLILCADTPLIKANILTQLWQDFRAQKVDAMAASFIAENPTGYGRIIKAGSGMRIVEEKDASAQEREVCEVNSGVYFINTNHIAKHIHSLSTQNESKEFYLTDLFQPQFNVTTSIFPQGVFFEGVNDLSQLERLQRFFMQQKILELQKQGVNFINGDTVYIEDDVSIGRGTTIYPGVHLFAGTVIEENVLIEPGVIIKNSTIAANSSIFAYSYMENTKIFSGAKVGPFARLREGTVIGSDCKIGNFVETKKAELASKVKVSHLSYVGDAQIGENTNIGCGFITCNYDGKHKHQTKIGKNAFIGSDCQMIAPIEIGDNSYIGSGSTINKDVPPNAFAIARERQTNKPDLAKKFLKNSD